MPPAATAESSAKSNVILSPITDNTAPTLYAFDNAFVTGNLVSGSNVVTNINDPRLRIGQVVTGDGIPDVIALTSGTNSGSNTVTLVAPNPNLAVGMPVVGVGIPAGTIIDSISGTTVTLSANATVTNPTSILAYGGARIVSINSGGNTITLSQNATTSVVGATIYSEYLAEIPASMNSSVVTIADTLTINGGAILQTTNAGNHRNSIVGGMLTSGLLNSDGTSADLIIHNWNPKAPLLIASNIVNNAALSRVVNLVQTGDGTTVLSGANTYTGNTYVQGGVLRLDSAGALPANSHLRLDGGVLGLNAGDFTRGLGTGATQVDWTSGGGFAAYTVNRTVNLGGAAAKVAWGAAGFVLDNTSLILGAQDANKTLIFANGIDLGRKYRMFEIISGSSSTYADARITGVLEGDAGNVVKAGNGVLELAAVNTYTGGTTLAEGTLVGVGNGAFGTGMIEVGTSTDTRSSGMALNLVFQGSTLANAMQFGNVNGDGVSVLATSASSTTVSGGIELGRVLGGNLLLVTADNTSADYQGVISGTGGVTLLGGGTVTLSGVNTYGSLTGASGSAANGGTIVRNGTLIMSNASSLGTGSTLELGDATFALANANYATAGSSLLGVERSLSNAVEGVGSLGGFFEATGGGLISLAGSLNSGPGAFYRVSRVIDGVTFGSADIGKTILVKDETDNPERNGVYSIIQVNDDLTINLVRVADFSTTTNMRYGAQVTVSSGTQANQTFFMAAPDVTAINGGDANPVHWVQDKSNPDVVFQVNNAAITSVTQAIDVNANGSGATTIVSANPVTFTNSVTLQDMQAGVQETKTLTINSGTSAGAGVAFSGVIREADGGTTAGDDILSLLKTGTGVATLTGANTYHGTTTVSSGTLLVNNTTGSGTGSSAVTVLSGATFGGSGTIAPADGNDINVLSGANLSVGTAGSLVAQTLTINLQTGSDLMLGGTLRLDLLLNQSNVTTAEADRLVFAKTGTPVVNLTGSTLVVSAINGLVPSAFNVGDTWKLIDWAGIVPTSTFSNLTGSYSSNFVDLPDVGSGRFWDISQLYSAGTIIVAVPEPGRLLLLIAGLLALGWRRRRQRSMW